MISQVRPAPMTVIYITVIKSVIRSVISRTKTRGNRVLLILSLIHISGKLPEINKHSLLNLFFKKTLFHYEKSFISIT